MRNIVLRAYWNDFVLFDDYEAAEVRAHHLCKPTWPLAELSSKKIGARPGIELGCTDLQAPVRRVISKTWVQTGPGLGFGISMG